MASSQLNIGAMVRAASIGFGVSLILLIASSALSFASTDQMLNSDFMVTGDLTSLGPLFAVSLCLGCVTYIWYAVVGVLYSVFAKRLDGTVEVGMGALGGGLSAVIIALLVGMIGAGIGLVVSADTYGEFAEAFGGDTAPFLMGTVIGGVIGICIAVVIGGALGAGGGAIYAAIARGRQQQES